MRALEGGALSHVFRADRGWGTEFTAFRSDGAVFWFAHRVGLGSSRFDDPPAWKELPPVPGTPAAEGNESAPAPAPTTEPAPKKHPSWSRTPRPRPRGRPDAGGAR